MRLQTYEHFADRDQLLRVVLERMLAGVSTRRYRRTQEPVGSEVEQAARSTSRSAASRSFVERTRRSLGELMSRNVLDHLPERDRPGVKQRLRRAWALDDHDRALDLLRQLAGELERSYPGAAGSLREGMEETLTLTRLGVTGCSSAHSSRPTLRVDDRDRPPHPTQRETLVIRGDGAAMDRRRDARSQTAVSTHHRLPRPRHPRRRDRTRPRVPPRTSHHDQGGRYVFSA